MFDENELNENSEYKDFIYNEQSYKTKDQFLENVSHFEFLLTNRLHFRLQFEELRKNLWVNIERYKLNISNKQVEGVLYKAFLYILEELILEEQR